MIDFKNFLDEEELVLSEAMEVLNEALIQFGGKTQTQFGQVVILAGGAGCYPGSTEVFDGQGWVRIDQFSDSKALVYDSVTGKAYMDDVQYVKLPVDQLYRIKNRRVDFITSENHKHLLISDKTGKTYTKTTLEIMDQMKRTIRGEKGYLVSSFNYDGGNGLDYSDDEIRLKVAVFADGHFLSVKEYPKVRMSFKKERKIERMRQLLTNLDKPYKEYEENDYTRFEFEMDNRDKEFGPEWYQCNRHQLSVIYDEVLQWDGSIVDRDGRNDQESFSSNSKKTIDFIQFLFSSFGNSSLIREDIRDGRNTNYSIVKANTGILGISVNDRVENSTKIETVESEDGMMYCLRTRTGFFPVRQNGRIYVSGNSGKGFVSSKLLDIQGKTLDVDALKSAAMKTAKIVKKVKKDLGVDITALDLKNPKDVFTLHSIVGDILNLPNKKEQALYSSIIAANPDRKPNLIFDVTLKDLRRLQSISYEVQKLGYKKENIHIVWVVNDIEVAKEQNRKRSRTVPEEILINTHRGASMTMKDILNMGERLKEYMDGFIFLAFNKSGEDATLVKSKSGGSYIQKGANYVKVKQRGSEQTSSDKLPTAILKKIDSYVPKADSWLGGKEGA